MAGVSRAPTGRVESWGTTKNPIASTASRPMMAPARTRGWRNQAATVTIATLPMPQATDAAHTALAAQVRPRRAVCSPGCRR
jgi:hypothetical protein